MEHKRGQWGSNIGFLMAAVGSAVGLGNIWGFPYKLGANGGFAFLLIYLALVLLVGFVVMLGELSIGRKTGKSTVHAYKELGKRYTWIGYLGVASSFIILAFYSVLGGYVLKYIVAFLGELFGASFGFAGASSSQFFNTFIANGFEPGIYHLIFMAITILIVMGGVEKGIERFSKIAMPLLAIMLVVVIIRSLTLEGAGEGLRFLFEPNLSVFSDPEIGFWNVLRSAAGQMFFSLSLGMGIMVTYGSYLSKKDNLEKNAVIIPLADTIVAIMAALAIMPAVFAFGLEPASGPSLLYVTLHEVFMSMGSFIGPLFGLIFYLLVFIAAVTSSISLLEVSAAYFIDRRIEQKKPVNRKKATCIIGAIIFLVGMPVALDGLGQGVASAVKPLGLIWLNFYDLLSEGIMMPLGALIMSLLIGWKLGTKMIQNEVELSGVKFRAYSFIQICLRFVIPVIMVLVLISQVNDFLTLGLF